MGDAIHILITGGAGQLGQELARLDWPADTVLHAPARAELDLGDVASVRAAFETRSFAAVINCGAYTAVDRAETEVAAAFAANALGPAILAELTRETGAPLIQLSTDYVFDGSANKPYVEDDELGPLNVYGASKLAGELAVRAGNPRSVVLRTAWVLSAHGANFLKTMLRLAADRPVLSVVDDQHGCPTSARDIASVLKAVTLRMIAEDDAPAGTYHFVNTGETTWAGLAREIFANSTAHGGVSAQVDGIATVDYSTPARRPANSRLSTEKLTRDYGITPRDWRLAVADIVAEYCAGRTVA
ncbi:dTDP-4-dehydrorhamnose reductase [Brevundimonas sp.]|uniref:dTDP-4-dehydrorhamnose reductase n=1 Tax=Brevundimonas sp. TaxID=1871086 RepID=UPI002D1397A0|nr:dTDP-4-dehydrorhamnose reductase [Brevundimonas sp.]HWQ88283.1 dTDP-4-dehydrorhamnose reductase [Brevundimonas sp.]